MRWVVLGGLLFVLVIAVVLLRERASAPDTGALSRDGVEEATDPGGVPPAQLRGAQRRPEDSRTPSDAAPPSDEGESGTWLEGTVRDARSGAGLTGAALTLHLGGSTGDYFEARPGGAIARAQSAADGTFRFRGKPREGLISIEATAEGYVTAFETLPDAVGGVRRVEIRLQIAGRLFGSVARADGSAAAGSTVYVLPGDAPEMLRDDPRRTVFGSQGQSKSLHGTVGEDGSFVVDGLEPGAVYLAVALGEGGASSTMAEGIYPTTAVPWVRQDLDLRRPAAIRVRVLDEEGRLLEAVQGVLAWRGTTLVPLAPTSRPGIYEAGGLPPKRHTVRVDAKPLLREEVDVDLVAGETVEVEVRPSVGVALAGVLVDDAGQPVPGQKLFVSSPWWRAGEVLDSSGSATTDGEGRFRIEGLRRLPHKVGLVLSPLHVPELQLYEPPDENARITVLRPSSMRARLVLPTEVDAPAEVEVMVRRPVREGWPEGTHGWQSSRRTVPVVDGLIEIEKLVPVSSIVVLRAAACAPSLHEVALEPGAELDLGDIRLELGTPLGVRVLGPEGNAIPDATVALSRRDVTDEEVTDGEGRCLFTGLGHGRHEITVEAEGFVPTRTAASLPYARDELDVKLSRGTRILLRVKTPESVPAAGVWVTWKNVASTEDEEVDGTDHRGALSFRVAPGRWRIEVQASDDGPGAHVEVDVEGDVEGDETIERELVLPAR